MEFLKPFIGMLLMVCFFALMFYFEHKVDEKARKKMWEDLKDKGKMSEYEREEDNG
jgi:cytochrome bd-type quinol oxidase subunit 2